MVSGGGGSSGGGNRSGNSSSNRGYTGGSGGRGSGGGSYRTSSGGGNSRNYSRQPSTYEKAKSSGQSSYNWFGSKLKEAGNIWNSWTKGMEKTVKHFCTTANRIKKDSAEFVKNIDRKKVGIGIGTTLVIAGVVAATGGAVVPILAGAAIGAGSSAVISGVVTAKHGGSIADVAKSASNGFMWGAIGGSVGGVTSINAAPAITKAFGTGLKSTLVTGGLTGAVGGGLTGGVMSGLSGNDAKTVLKDTVKSAAAGAAIGVASAGIGYGINSLRSGGATGTAGSGGEAGKNESALIKKGSSKTDFYVTPNGDAIPSTGYRYISKNASYLDDMTKSMTIPANKEGTYFSFNNYDVANPGALQVPHDASVKVSFDTLQIIDDISVPNGNWGKATYLEPITKDFPEFGPGGATQAITHSEININTIDKLPKK